MGCDNSKKMTISPLVGPVPWNRSGIGVRYRITIGSQGGTEVDPYSYVRYLSVEISIPSSPPYVPFSICSPEKVTRSPPSKVR